MTEKVRYPMTSLVSHPCKSAPCQPPTPGDFPPYRWRVVPHARRLSHVQGGGVGVVVVRVTPPHILFQSCSWGHPARRQKVFFFKHRLLTGLGRESRSSYGWWVLGPERHVIYVATDMLSSNSSVSFLTTTGGARVGRRTYFGLVFSGSQPKICNHVTLTYTCLRLASVALKSAWEGKKNYLQVTTKRKKKWGGEQERKQRITASRGMAVSLR